MSRVETLDASTSALQSPGLRGGWRGIVLGILFPRRSSLAARLTAVVLGLAPLSGASSSFAQAPPSVADKETARTLMNAGDDRFEASDFAGALTAYQGADTIMHLPMTGVALARAQAALGLLLEARDTALQVTHQPEQPGENTMYAEARVEARALADTLVMRLPSLDLQPSASPAGLVVSIDDVPLPPAALAIPRKVNPGKHVVTARAPGFVSARVEVTVAERAVLPVALRLDLEAPASPPMATTGTPVTPPPVAPPPRQKVSLLVYLGFGIGGAPLIVGAVTGGLSLSKTSSLATRCDAAKRCAAGSPGASDLAAATTLASISNITIAVGVAGMVTGIVGLVLSRGDRHAVPKMAIAPVIGPGTLGVAGAF